MQIIIDIDEEDYQNLKAKDKFDDMYLNYYEKLIVRGTPLPKHGGLIDMDYLREDFKTSKKISFAERMDISCIINHAPIIIEPNDTESEG